MALGKQAKILSPAQESLVLRHIESSRHPDRNRVITLLTFKAGLRAKEVASLTWSMVTDPHGGIANEIALPNVASKGKGGGRQIPLHSDLRDALNTLKAARGDRAKSDSPIIYSERQRGMSAASVANWFHGLYRTMGLEGCSSHSGRRTFITNAARKIVQAGGSLRDVQQLAGHANLNTTMRYIEGSSDAKRRLIDML